MGKEVKAKENKIFTLYIIIVWETESCCKSYMTDFWTQSGLDSGLEQ